ncbi:dihydrofolate reductase [Kribbella voronezhensis]|uniref:Dihydrofolate reductase n=1 Tax=Kribbella voronezhensis TaxID=2512212 RepID=A0A4R7TDJ4_9ACTN|nr:dihydrofolate reductase family protein [Kribbella voronezhensis]TDU89849.1 dihydrofolate reductase [Kribbella voronezhensis]
MAQDDGGTGQGQRKVVAAYFVSLDGVAEAADRFLTGWDDEVDARGSELIADQDTIILGRRTYDEWVGFWPTSDVEPFASFINAAPKFVATSTPLESEWANSSVIEGDLVEFVKDLKSQPGGDIGIHGSISVTQTLLAAGLVDELQLVVVPTIAPPAGQKKLLDNLPPIKLETVNSAVSSSGYVLSTYRVVH